MNRYRPPASGRRYPQNAVYVRYPGPASARAAAPTVYARPARRSDPFLTAVIVVVAGALGLLVLALAAIFSFYGYYQATGRIVPGVRLGPQPLGGMTLSQAAAEINRAWNLERSIVVTDGLNSWQAAPANLGLSIDAVESARLASAVGHNQGLMAELGQMAVALLQGWEIRPAAAFDPDTARQGLEALSAQGSREPKNASFYIQNGQLVPVPGELGFTFNIDETLAALEAAPQAVLANGMLPVVLKPIPPAVTDVTPALEEARRLVTTPVSLKTYDALADETQDLPVPQEAVASWLAVEAGEQGPRAVIDAGRTAAYLAQVNASLGPGRSIDPESNAAPLAAAVQEGRSYLLPILHPPTTYTVEAGDTLLRIGWKVGMPFWRILQANPGMDPEALWAGQQITIPSLDEQLPLPIVPGKRIVISISKQRLWAYENGELAAKYVISTGIDRSPTQPGIFQVQTHDRKAYASVWDLTMPNFLGIYEAWPGFMNGIHGLPTLSNGRQLWANILGQPASYGCIILDMDASRWLYDWAENGVVVVIEA